MIYANYRELDRKVEELLKNTSGEIEFRSYVGHTGRPQRLQPYWEEAVSWYRGVARITKELRESGKPFVDPENSASPLSSIIIHTGKTMGLSKEADRLVLSWLLRTNKISLAYEDAINDKANPDALFFVYNRVVDTNRKIKRFDLKFEAMSAIRNLSSDNVSEIVRLLGFNMAHSMPEELRTFLYEQIEDPKKGIENAEKILATIGDPNKDTKLWIYKAIDMGIIQQNEGNGSYRYGETFIGYGIPEVVAFVENSKNEGIVNHIQEQLQDFAITNVNNRKRSPRKKEAQPTEE